MNSERQSTHASLLELFDELTLRQKLRKLWRGLRQPKDSGEFKWARLQLVRLSAPLLAIVVPVLALYLLMALAGTERPPTREVEVILREPEPVEKLESIENILDEPIEPPEPVEIDFAAETRVDIDRPLPPAPDVEVTAQPAEFDAVAIVKSPVIMKGIFGSRTPGGRRKAMTAYGGGGVTEGAVLRALRWLKKNQNPDGSWPRTKPAMTALALLTFLAHGETPASEEFGETVENAIKYLMANRDAQGGWPRKYQHAIVTYALCETYALTRIPMLKDAIETAVDILIAGQNATGGFDYLLNNTDRDDTSVMGWCAQALKAAQMAGLERPGLDAAMRLAIKGFQNNADPNGGFGYVGPGQGGLTGVGVLAMQLLGAPNAPEVKKGLAYLEDWTFDWREPQGKSPVYYWYYITQAKFHVGGNTWNRWNNRFSSELVRHQQIIKEAISGPDDTLRDIGFWETPSEHEHTDGRVMDTCLCTLQLQVYYRYLPTFKPPTDFGLETDYLEDEEDLEIEIDI